MTNPEQLGEITGNYIYVIGLIFLSCWIAFKVFKSQREERNKEDLKK